MSEKWHSVGQLCGLSEDAPTNLQINALGVAAFKVQGHLFAIENVCPHAYALLTDGFLDGTTIECPLHGAVFSLVTGQCLKKPARRGLKTYEVCVTGQEIKIKV